MHYSTHTPTEINTYTYSFCLQFSVSYSTQHIYHIKLLIYKYVYLQ